LKAGDQVVVVAKHARQGEIGTLVAFGPYGPAHLRWTGWLVKDKDGNSYYCQPEALAKIKSPAINKAMKK